QLLFVLRKTRPPMRKPCGWNRRGSVRPMLEQVPLGFEQVREMLALITVQPAAEREVMRALDVVDGINLYEAQLLNQPGKRSACCLARGVGEQALRAKEQAAGSFIGNQWRVHFIFRRSIGATVAHAVFCSNSASA